MKILRNLFGDGAKIHSDNIEVGTSTNHRSLSDSVIVESGSNANGSWIKFADGTMICTMPVRVIGTRVSVFAVNDATQSYWTFPVSFLSAPVVTAVIDGGNAREALVSVLNTADTSASGVNVRAYHPTGSYNSATTLYAKAIAIGRWK